MSDRFDRRDEPRRRGGHVDDLVAVYALDALEPRERARVDHHCRGCARCAGLVAADRAAVAPLGLLVPRASPDPAVRSALLARVAAAHAAAERSTVPARARPMATIPASRPLAPQPARPAAPGRRWFPLPPAFPRFAALPLILVLAVAGGLAVESLGRGDGDPNWLTNMATRSASGGSDAEPDVGRNDRGAAASPGRAADASDGAGESDRSRSLALGGIDFLSFDTGLPGTLAATTSARLDLGRGATGRATDADGGMDAGGGPG